MKTSDLTTGSIPKHLIRLTAPLIAGNILQQLYNTVDALVLSRFAGAEEFAAIGVAGSVMNLFLFAIVGACIGISVLLAQFYGAGDMKQFKQEHFLAVTAGCFLSGLLGLLGIAGITPLLSLLHTPPEISGYTKTYVSIVLLALPASFLYNFYSALFRSVGKAKTALSILAFAPGLNLLLDLLFTAGFSLGVAGVAWATLIAQVSSAALCILSLKKQRPDLMFSSSDRKFDRTLLRTTAHFSMVTGLHQAGLYLGKLMVQGAVNTGGTDIISAYTATTRIEGFANSFGDSGASATSVVVAQNFGAKKKERVRQTFWYSLLLISLLGILSSVILFAAAGPVTAFVIGPEHTAACESARQYTRIIAVFYLLCFTGNTFAGYFDGCGKVTVSMLGAASHITLRVILSWMFVGRYRLNAIAVATGIGWILVNVFWSFCYRRLS